MLTAMDSHVGRNDANKVDSKVSYVMFVIPFN
jgi:hypothetical protein